MRQNTPQTGRNFGFFAKLLRPPDRFWDAGQQWSDDSRRWPDRALGADWLGRAPLLISKARTTAKHKGIPLYKIAALWLALHGGVAPPAIDGSYVAKTLNGHALPAELRIPAPAGDFRLFRLEQGVLRLNPDGRFTLYFRYYHQLVRRGGRPTTTPVLSEAEKGTYTVDANRLILTPTRRKGGRSNPTVVATISGLEIRASYVLQSAGTRETVALLLRRDASYW